MRPPPPLGLPLRYSHVIVVPTSRAPRYWVPGREAQTLGSVITTWTARQPDELGVVRMRTGPFAQHAWAFRPWPYPRAGAGSWAEFAPRSEAADRLLDGLIGPLLRNYQCDAASLQCKPAPRFPNGSSWTNGSDYLSTWPAHTPMLISQPQPPIIPRFPGRHFFPGSPGYARYPSAWSLQRALLTPQANRGVTRHRCGQST